MTTSFQCLQVIFLQLVALLYRLASSKEHALALSRWPELLQTWETIAAMLSRKIELELKCVQRLKGA